MRGTLRAQGSSRVPFGVQQGSTGSSLSAATPDSHSDSYIFCIDLDEGRTNPPGRRFSSPGEVTKKFNSYHFFTGLKGQKEKEIPSLIGEIIASFLIQTGEIFNSRKLLVLTEALTVDCNLRKGVGERRRCVCVCLFVSLELVLRVSEAETAVSAVSEVREGVSCRWEQARNLISP